MGIFSKRKNEEDRLWLTPKNISEWAFKQCVEGKDTKEMRDMITHSHWAYLYCRNIKLDADVASRVKHPTWSGLLCLMLEDLLELIKYSEKWKSVYESLLPYARWCPLYMTNDSSSSKYGSRSISIYCDSGS